MDKSNVLTNALKRLDDARVAALQQEEINLMAQMIVFKMLENNVRLVWNKKAKKIIIANPRNEDTIQ